MKNHNISIAFVLSLLSTAKAFTVLSPGYTAENYAQYVSSTSSGRMVFDDSGNIYIGHYDDGKIMKVSTDQTVSTLITGLGNITDITWGGGTVFGNYLYAGVRTGTWTGNISRIDLDGKTSYFANMDNPKHGVAIVGIDRTGNYDGKMFSSGTGQDRLYNITTSGQVSLFVDWPPHTDGGGSRGIGFDMSGKYSNKMYIANAFQETNPGISGLFAVNPDGSSTKFCSNIVQAFQVRVDGDGSYFAGDMFVVGRDVFGGVSNLWRVFEDGTSEEFMTGVGSFTFGADGAMYVSSYNWSTQEVTISRIIPEPATLLLFSLGTILLRKRSSK